MAATISDERIGVGPGEMGLFLAQRVETKREMLGSSVYGKRREGTC